LAWRVGSQFTGRGRLLAIILVLTSVPFFQILYLGQPMLLLGWAVAECYLALRRKEDFRAGLWLTCLLLKPQYGLLLWLLFVWKRRWTTIAGVAVGGLAVLASSILVAGPAAVLAYPASLSDIAGFRGGPNTFPDQMSNWRAVVLWLLPGVGDRTGLALTLALSGATVALAAIAWLGAWHPGDSRFAVRMVALLAATLLSSYHSHIYGGILLALPVGAMVAHGNVSAVARSLVVLSLCLPLVLGVGAMLVPQLALASGPLYALVLLAYVLVMLGELGTLKAFAGRRLTRSVQGHTSQFGRGIAGQPGL
jgi:hypothetical protein